MPKKQPRSSATVDPKTRGGDYIPFQTRRPSLLTLGDELEYRVARLQIFMGYFVRRGCALYTVAALDRATDVDVLALRYTEPFRRQCLVTECKSGGNGPLDRIFWLTGVKRYLGSEEAILVRKGTKWNIKDFAKQCGVQIIDLFRITELEAKYGVGKDDWPGVSDRGFQEREIDVWNTALTAESKLWELYLTLTSEVRYEEAFPAITYISSQLRLLTRTWVRVPTSSFYRHLLSESVSQLAVFLMRVAEQTFDLNRADRAGFIRKGLSYGSLEPHYVDRILNSAYNLTRQAVFHYTNRSVNIDKSLFEMPTPPETDAVVAIVEEIVDTYPASLSFPQICDLMLSEVFTKGNKSKGWLKRIFPDPDLRVRLDLVRKFLRVLHAGGACPSYVLDALSLAPPESAPAVVPPAIASQDPTGALAAVPAHQRELDLGSERAAEVESSKLEGPQTTEKKQGLEG